MGHCFYGLVLVDAELLEKEGFCQWAIDVDFVAASGILQHIHHYYGVILIEYFGA